MAASPATPARDLVVTAPVTELVALEQDLVTAVPDLLVDGTAAGRKARMTTIQPRVEALHPLLADLAPAVLCLLGEPAPAPAPGVYDRLIADLLAAADQLRILLRDLGVEEYQRRTAAPATWTTPWTTPTSAWTAPTSGQLH